MPSLPKDTLAVLFVHFITAGMCGATGWFVYTQGSNLPVMDEWDVLAEWATADSTAEWAMRHHSEHRYPLGKLVWLGVLRATGYNFKAPMYLTVGLLTAAAILFQWTARGARGRSHPIDAAFPVLLLHFGHGFNLIMGYQLGFALVAYGVAGWVWCAGRLASGGGFGWAWLSGAYAVAVALCGGFGLAFIPVVVAWVGFLGWRAATCGAKWRAGGFALVGLGLCGYAAWILATLPPFIVQGADPLKEPGAFIGGAAGYLSVGLGTWPATLGYSAVVATGVAVSVVLGAVAAGVGVRAGSRRPLAVAIGLVLLGELAIGAATARARGVGMQDRFATPSAAGLCAVVLVLTTRLPSGWRNRIGSSALLVVAGGVVWLNIEPGLRLAYYVRGSLWDLNQDIAAGLPPAFLAGRSGGTLGVLVGDRTAGHIDVFRRVGIPQFRTVPDNPTFTPVPIPSFDGPVTIRYRPELLPPDAPAPELRFPRPPVGCLGVRLRVTTVESGGWQRLVARWTDPLTGQGRSRDADPPWARIRMHLVFPFEGTPTDLRITAGSMLPELVIETAEWLVPMPPPGQH